ncbi:MAG: hypothetical protein Q7S22_03990 [Candidatus Micrarchaeota archaeon]|nr:hypothetical protein [Candidatus Micrarchaeota archaeon]
MVNVAVVNMLGDSSWASKTISDHYGDGGVKVYKLIDGKKSILEISKQAGLGQQKVVEIIKFMETEGIIKLDYGQKKNILGSLSSFPLNLPQDLYARMQQHSEINWNDVVGRLLSVYLGNIESTEKSLIGRISEKTKKLVKTNSTKKIVKKLIKNFAKTKSVKNTSSKKSVKKTMKKSVGKLKKKSKKTKR